MDNDIELVFHAFSLWIDGDQSTFNTDSVITHMLIQWLKYTDTNS